MPKRSRKNKAGLLAELIETRQKIIGAVLRLSPQQQGQVFLGQWTVQDLLAHLAGWDQTNQTAAAQILAGQIPDFFQQQDKDWQTFNAALVQDYGQGRFEEVLDRVRQSHKLLIARLGAIDEQDFARTVAHGRRSISIAGLLGAEARDEQEHLQQIEAFFSPPGGRPPQEEAT